MMEKTKFKNTDDFHESVLEHVERELTEILPISLENEFNGNYEDFSAYFTGILGDSGNMWSLWICYHDKNVEVGGIQELEADMGILWLKYLDNCDEPGFQWELIHDNDIEFDIELNEIISELEDRIIKTVRNNF